MANTELDLTTEFIDVRGIIKRFEELENDDEDIEELATLLAILDDLKGNGGDEKWRGNWYPATLIHDSYFVNYTQELLADIGYIPRDFPHWIVIDWEQTADNVRVDYSAIEIDGITYWYR